MTTGMRAQMTEQTLDTYRGGGVIPSAIPRLLTSSKYSRAPTKTAAARATVKTHPPVNTTPPTKIPMPSPKTTLFFNWLFFSLSSEVEISPAGVLLHLLTSYNIIISVVPIQLSEKSEHNTCCLATLTLMLILEVATPEVKQWLGHLPKIKQWIQDQKAKADPHI